jgi:hypothetical protein
MIVKKSISCRTSTCSQGHQQRLAVDPNITPIVSPRTDCSEYAKISFEAGLH